ncbi:MAG TPA: XrtA system polysaccharide deacetylase [Gammaproteobacteria bacterium]|nr:XrtA system polysaccharide deacetylase [Gammaproteobacteria bacterium]
MSVDVEDYFQVSAFEHRIRRSEWDRFECRVPGNLARILDRFERHGVRATFFTLGWVARRYPECVRRIVAGGHELASHGYLHRRVTDLSPARFRRDVRAAKALLEDIAGQPVRGYRAPSYSICAETLWALEVLEEEGFGYSSSVYPIRHDHYGMPEAPRHPFRPTPSGALLEVPVSTLRLAGCCLPCGGGGYFRLLPYGVSRWALGRVNRVEGRPTVFYFHPWEIDPDQPRQPGLPWRTRFRHYLNLHRTEDRLERLLGDFRWDRMDRVFLARGPGGEGAA